MGSAYYCREPGCDHGSGPVLSFAEKLEARWTCAAGHRNDIGYHGETRHEALIELEERVARIEGFLNL